MREPKPATATEGGEGLIDMAKDETVSVLAAEVRQLDSRVKVVSGQQANILSALGMILDTLRAQYKMLQQLTALAREEPAASATVESLHDLTNAISAMDSSLQALGGRLDELPQAVVTELSNQGWASADAPG